MAVLARFGEEDKGVTVALSAETSAIVSVRGGN